MTITAAFKQLSLATLQESGYGNIPDFDTDVSLNVTRLQVPISPETHNEQGRRN